MDLLSQETLDLMQASLFGIGMLAKATIVLIVAMGLSWCLRKKSAAVRHSVWSLALMMTLLLPIFSLWMPVWQVNLPRAWDVRVERSSDLQSSIPVRTETAETEGVVSNAVPNLAPSSSVRAVVPSVSDGDELASSSSPKQSRVVLLFLAVWFSGAVLLVARLLLHFIRARYLLKTAYAEQRDGASALLASLAVELKIHRTISVLISDRISMPVTWGLQRPVILLPAIAVDWPPERLRVVLLHELAHIKRWDYLTHVVTELACAFYWPNPLVWIARKRAHLEQEQACDDRVLSTGTRSFVYAEHLLQIARAFHGNHRSFDGTIAMAREISLKGRIRAILDDGLNRHSLSARTGMFVAAMLAVVVLPLAALHPGNSAEENVVKEEHPQTYVDTKDAPTEAGSTFIWIESEDARLQAPMEVYTDVQASGGRYVLVPDGEGNDAPEGGPGRAEFTFEVEKDAIYVIWGRVIGDYDNDNSFYISVDDGPESRWDIVDENGDPDVDDWEWLPFISPDQGRGRSKYFLSEGSHNVFIRNREDGTRLDRILVTDDFDFVPEGRGPSPVGLKPYYSWIEAEDAVLELPVHVRSDERASGEAFVWAENGTGQRGSVTITFQVPEPGTYIVWGRVLAPSKEDNSFFVWVDNEPEVIWDVPGADPDRTAKRWVWDPVSARDENRAIDPVLYYLDEGIHTIRVRTREDGTKLDGLFVTNDLSFIPRGIHATPPVDEPVYIRQEAEEAFRIEQPMHVIDDPAVSGGSFIGTEGRSKFLDNPPVKGRAVYRLEIDQPGTYALWGRTYAEDGESDSFWVRIDGGRWIKWDLRDRDDWRWNEVRDGDYGNEFVQFDLVTGVHTLEIAHRESGSGLDRFVVTNDPLFDPADEDQAEKQVEVVFR